MKTTRQYATNILSIVGTEILYAIQDLTSTGIYGDDIMPTPQLLDEWEQDKEDLIEFLTNIKEQKKANCNLEKISKWIKWIKDF